MRKYWIRLESWTSLKKWVPTEGCIARSILKLFPIDGDLYHIVDGESWLGTYAHFSKW